MRQLKLSLVFGLVFMLVMGFAAASFGAVNFTYSSDKQTVAPGDTFTVTAKVELTADHAVAGGEVYFGFDQTKLQITASDKGDFPGGSMYGPFNTAQANADGSKFKWNHLDFTGPTISLGTYTYGTVTFQVQPGVTGALIFTKTAESNFFDGTSAKITGTVGNPPPVEVIPGGNHAPVTTDGTLTTKEGKPKDGILAATDADAGDTLTFSVVTNPTKGTVNITNTPTVGAYTYTPNAGVTGPTTDSFTFKANDSKDDSNTATVTVTITVNKAPVATDGTLTTKEGKANTGILTATDADGDTLTYSIVANPTKGTVNITDTATGAYTYTPNAGVTGDDTFTFKANDGTVDSAQATVTVTITPNNAPVAQAGTLAVIKNTPKDGTLVATDADAGDTLTYSVVTNPTKGTVNITNTPEAGAYTYTPNANETGDDSFTFKANDGLADSAPATVTVTIADNTAPVATDMMLTTKKNIPVSGTLTATDADAGDTLTYSVVANPAHGTVAVTPASGAFIYTPTTDFVGTDSFTFKANDTKADSNVATVSITVKENSAPVAAPVSATTDKDVVLNCMLAATDADHDPLTYSIVSQPAHGTVTVTPATGAFVYTPTTNYLGTDTFTYKANDGTADSNTATVTITVSEVQFTLDIDGDGQYGALTDGFLVMSYLFGFTGNALTGDGDFIAPNATRTDPAAIKTFLDTANMDVDGNGFEKPLTDGMLILRALFGFTGTTLTDGALGPDATRTDPAAILAFIQQMKP